MAITKIHPIKTTLKKSIEYICNDQKTDGSCLISTHACAAQTADFDFKYALSKSRDNGKNLAYHLIQSFAPGEVSPTEAHDIAKELAEQHLCGRYSYVIATHIDRGHVHSHIIFCAADNINFRKYNDCKKTYAQIRRTSDRICAEHKLSVITEAKHLGKSYKAWMIALSKTEVMPFKGDTAPKDSVRSARFLEEHTSLIDTSKDKFLSSPGLRKWASKENLKRAGELYARMQELGFQSLAELHEYNVSNNRTDRAKKAEIKAIEKQMTDISEIIKYVTQYTDTLGISQAYQRSKDKDRFLREHESELLLYDAAEQILKHAKINLNTIDISMLKSKFYSLKDQKYQLVKQIQSEKTSKDELAKLESELHGYLSFSEVRSGQYISSKDTF